MIVNKQSGSSSQSGTCHCTARPYPHYHVENQQHQHQQQHQQMGGAFGRSRAVPVEQIHYPNLGIPDSRPGAPMNGATTQPNAQDPSGNSLRVAAGNANGGSPTVRRKLTPVETVADCERESGELDARIDELVRAGLLVRHGRSNEYRSLEEQGMRIILRLDELDCTDDPKLRADRKRIVQFTQCVLEKLEKSAIDTPTTS